MDWISFQQLPRCLHCFFRDDPVTGMSLGSHRGGEGKGRSSAGIHRPLASPQNVVMSKIKLKLNKWLYKMTMVAFKAFLLTGKVKHTVFFLLCLFSLGSAEAKCW